MQQEELQQIQKWCQQSEDAILFYAPDGTLLWQNDAAAVRQKPQNSSLPRYHKNGAPEDGMFLLRQGGSLYCVRQEPRQYGEKPAILVQIHSQLADDLLWSDADKQHETENRIAAMRQKIFGISNAVSGLYQTLEENGDQIPRMVLEEQMEQLNIIQGNCCRLMRPSVLWLEQLKYVQKNELSGEALFLDRELSNFVESCRMVLGRAIRMTLKTAPHLHCPPPAAACEPALSDFTAAADYAVCVPFHLAGEQQENEAVLRCTAVSDGTEPQSHRHSIPEQLYQTGWHAGGTGRTALLPEVSRRPAHLPDRHPGTVYPALSLHRDIRNRPWKAAAGRSTTASFRCIRSSFPTFRLRFY
ncbi:MAG: hypothetical protein ACLT29_07715 [Ruminococcus callidus]